MAGKVANRVVAIACSAGGLSALQKILSDLPNDFPAPVIVAQHRGDYQIDLLLDLLRSCSNMPVKSAEWIQRLEPACIYVCPRGRHIELMNQRMLRTWSGPRLDYVRPSANLLFQSVARNFANRSLCVVLSGGGTDGALATRAVREAGGFVIVQDQASAEFPGMPAAAVEFGKVDLILPPEHIGCALSELISAPVAV